MEERLSVGRHLAQLTKLYAGVISKKLEHLDIERYFHVLLTIDKSENKITQQEVANQLELDKVTMVKMVDYLAQKGYLNREQNPNDRREYHLCLTEKAQQVIPEIKEAFQDIHKAATNGLTKNQIDEFYKVVERIDKNLRKLPNNKVNIRIKKS